ncbi:hypothetical protein [Actinoplanes sp. NPDC049599]|uniref:hypothetical protein n=1 Tax=Actinoplanes sp. NPDC049599 TaxID=3363903 RepID=UPI00379412E5
MGLLGLGVFLAIGTYMVVDLPPVTRAGSAVLLRERAELSDSASWFRRVAANGESELWRMDAAFAEQAGAFSGELPKLPVNKEDVHQHRLVALEGNVRSSLFPQREG